jgi:hypothetical protein
MQAASPNAIGFFYYFGQGASDESANYLIPFDVKTTDTVATLLPQNLQREAPDEGLGAATA